MSPSSERGAEVAQVRVPCSTSNLGPGFDFLGLALSLELRVRMRAGRAGAGHELARLSGTAVDWPRGPENLLLRAFDLARERLGAARRRMIFEVDSEIPLARGLGSSGAAIAAGLLLGAHGAPREAGLAELLALGLELEGHPDNSSAALAGGCTLAVPRPGGGVVLVRQELSPELGFVLAWPEAQLATRRAREVLPREVSFADAVENPRRLALLLEGLRRADPELLRLGCDDRLHVRYRLPLIPGGEPALRAALDAGAWAATISGSGSALIAITSRDRRELVAAAFAAELTRHSGAAQTRIVEPVLGTPRVVSA